MAEKGERLVLDEHTGQLVFTVETVYLFPVNQDEAASAGKDEQETASRDSDSAGALIKEQDATVIEPPLAGAEAGSEDTPTSDEESELQDVSSLPDVVHSQGVDRLLKREEPEAQLKSEDNSSAFSTPKTRGPQSWDGPRPWVVNGKGKAEVVPVTSEMQSAPPSRIPRPATPPFNVKSPKARSAPQSPTGRYPWTSVLRNRRGSTGKNPKEYVEQPIPIDFEDEEQPQGEKTELPQKETKEETKLTVESKGLKRPLARLFPKSKGPSSVGHGVKVSKKGQGQYEEFDSNSWSHVASEEDFELFPSSLPPAEARQQHALASDLDTEPHDGLLTSADPDTPPPLPSTDPPPLQLSTRTDRSSTKHSKHVTDWSTAESATTTNVTSDHSITFDRASATSVKTVTEHVEEVTTVTSSVATDWNSESTGSRLRSSSLVKEFMDELEQGSRKRAYSLPEQDVVRPRKKYISVPTTPLSPRPPQTPGSDVIEFACGVKFERHSPSPSFRLSDTDLYHGKDDIVRDDAASTDERTGFSSFRINIPKFMYGSEDSEDVAQKKEDELHETDTVDVSKLIDQFEHYTSEKGGSSDESEEGPKLEIRAKKHTKKTAPRSPEIPNLHVDKDMSLEDMLETLKTYLSSEDLLDDRSDVVEEEIHVKYTETKISITPHRVPSPEPILRETERREEILVSPRSPKILRAEPELEKTLQTIRGMLSSSTEFLDFDVDVEDMPSPFEKSDGSKLSMFASEFVEVLYSLKEVLHLATHEIDPQSHLGTKRQMSKSESDFEATLKSVREFLECDAAVLDTSSDELGSMSDDSDLDQALDAIADANALSSDCDSDRDGTGGSRYKKHKRANRKKRPVDLGHIDTGEVPTATETATQIPFHRYESFESKVPVEITVVSVAHTTENGSFSSTEDGTHVKTSELERNPEVSTLKEPVEAVDFWCGSRDLLGNEKETPKISEDLLTYETDNKEKEQEKKSYGSQDSIGFAPVVSEIATVDRDEKQDAECPAVAKDRSDSKSSSTDTSKSSGSSSVDFKEPPRESSSPRGTLVQDAPDGDTQGISEQIAVENRTQGKDPPAESVPPEETSADHEANSVAQSAAQLVLENETHASVNVVGMADSSKVEFFDENLKDMQEHKSKESSSESDKESSLFESDLSSSEAEYYFDDDSSSLSILSAIGNRHSDFGSIEYLYVDLDQDIAAAEAAKDQHELDELDERRKELESQITMQMEVENLMKDFENQKRVMKLEELETTTNEKQEVHNEQEVFEEVVVQTTAGAGSWDVLEDIRLRHEDTDGKTPTELQTQEEVHEEVIAESTAAAGSFDFLEEIRTRHEHVEVEEADLAIMDDLLVEEPKRDAGRVETMEEMMARIEAELIDAEKTSATEPDAPAGNDFSERNEDKKSDIKSSSVRSSSSESAQELEKPVTDYRKLSEDHSSSEDSDEKELIPRETISCALDTNSNRPEQGAVGDNQTSMGKIEVKETVVLRMDKVYTQDAQSNQVDSFAEMMAKLEEQLVDIEAVEPSDRLNNNNTVDEEKLKVAIERVEEEHRLIKSDDTDQAVGERKHQLSDGSLEETIRKVEQEHGPIKSDDTDDATGKVHPRLGDKSPEEAIGKVEEEHTLIKKGSREDSSDSDSISDVPSESSGSSDEKRASKPVTEYGILDEDSTDEDSDLENLVAPEDTAAEGTRSREDVEAEGLDDVAVDKLHEDIMSKFDFLRKFDRQEKSETAESSTTEDESDTDDDVPRVPETKEDDSTEKFSSERAAVEESQVTESTTEHSISVKEYSIETVQTVTRVEYHTETITSVTGARDDKCTEPVVFDRKKEVDDEVFVETAQPETDVDNDDAFLPTGAPENSREPLASSNRPDRLSIHRMDTFQSFEEGLEHASAEKLSSSSASSSSAEEEEPPADHDDFESEKVEEGRLIKVEEHVLEPPVSETEKAPDEDATEKPEPAVLEKSKSESSDESNKEKSDSSDEKSPSASDSGAEDKQDETQEALPTATTNLETGDFEARVDSEDKTATPEQKSETAESSGLGAEAAEVDEVKDETQEMSSLTQGEDNPQQLTEPKELPKQEEPPSSADKNEKSAKARTWPRLFRRRSFKENKDKDPKDAGEGAQKKSEEKTGFVQSIRQMTRGFFFSSEAQQSKGGNSEIRTESRMETTTKVEEVTATRAETAESEDARPDIETVTVGDDVDRETEENLREENKHDEEELGKNDSFNNNNRDVHDEGNSGNAAHRPTVEEIVGRLRDGGGRRTPNRRRKRGWVTERTYEWQESSSSPDSEKEVVVEEEQEDEEEATETQDAAEMEEEGPKRMKNDSVWSCEAEEEREQKRTVGSESFGDSEQPRDSTSSTDSADSSTLYSSEASTKKLSSAENVGVVAVEMDVSESDVERRVNVVTFADMEEVEWDEVNFASGEKAVEPVEIPVENDDQEETTQDVFDADESVETKPVKLPRVAVAKGHGRRYLTKEHARRMTIDEIVSCLPGAPSETKRPNRAVSGGRRPGRRFSEPIRPRVYKSLSDVTASPEPVIVEEPHSLENSPVLPTKHAHDSTG